MFDAVLHYRERASERVRLESYQLQQKAYALCTLHRQENTDDPTRLNSILSALRTIAQDLPMVLPLHPRTKAKLAQQNNNGALKGLKILDPLPYLEMQRLQMSARLILTDSGGIQKEAYFHQVPCITMRDETEWAETLDAGWNQLVGANEKNIIHAALNAKAHQPSKLHYLAMGRRLRFSLTRSFSTKQKVIIRTKAHHRPSACEAHFQLWRDYAGG